jgi:transcriptional regulator with XRE-family HTH domain
MAVMPLQSMVFVYNSRAGNGENVKKLEADRDTLSSFGSRVKEVRKALRISQKDFAASLGMSGSYLSEIEHGNAAPGYEFLFKLSALYRVSLDYLVHGGGAMMLAEVSGGPGKKTREEVTRVEDSEDILWLMAHSPMFRNTLLGFSQKFYYENERIIRKDIMEFGSTDPKEVNEDDQTGESSSG